jgi:hypothetical protein
MLVIAAILLWLWDCPTHPRCDRERFALSVGLFHYLLP